MKQSREKEDISPSDCRDEVLHGKQREYDKGESVDSEDNGVVERIWLRVEEERRERVWCSRSRQ